MQQIMKLTPQMQLAQALSQSGSSTAPVQSPLEGITRALTGVVGGYMRGREETRQKEEKSAQAKALAKALASGTPDIEALAADPLTSDLAQTLAVETYKQNIAPPKLQISPYDGEIYNMRDGTHWNSGNPQQSGGAAPSMGGVVAMPDLPPVPDGLNPMQRKLWQEQAIKAEFEKTKPMTPKELLAQQALDKKAAQEKTQSISKAQGLGAQIDNVSNNIKTAKQQLAQDSIISPRSGFLGSVAGMIPATGAYDFGKTLDTIKANIGFDALQNMRDNSPTGGALGQVAVQELEALRATVANLDQAQSREQLSQNLDILDQRYKNTLQKLKDAYMLDNNGSLEGFDKYFVKRDTAQQPAPVPSVPALPSGWSVRVK